MVSTRSHPNSFPEPDLSPSHQTPTRSRQGRWAHTPSNLTLLWLWVSVPLVIWDTVYVLFRPHTMPGGWLHKPFYTPYELYGRIDYVYGWKAFNEKSGFTAAQATMNVVETLLYIYYLYILYAHGRSSSLPGRGAPKPTKVGMLGESRYVDGKMAGVACLVAYSSAVMTLSKTVLYGLNEYYSGFANVGHNSLQDLVILWVIPNGAWLVLPTYITYVSGSEILQGLAAAGGASTTSEDDSSIKQPVLKAE